MLAVISIIYSIGALIVFLLLLTARNHKDVQVIYDDYRAHAFIHQFGEIALFALVALFWPIVITTIKIRKNS